MDLPPEASAVNHPDGEWRAVELLLRKLQVDRLDRDPKVGVPLGVQDHRGLDHMAWKPNTNDCRIGHFETSSGSKFRDQD